MERAADDERGTQIVELFLYSNIMAFEADDFPIFAVAARANVEWDKRLEEHGGGHAGHGPWAQMLLYMIRRYRDARQVEAGMQGGGVSGKKMIFFVLIFFKLGK